MKAVMISIRHEWCEKIARGKKTVEVRKTKPKLETPFKCFIYCTKPKQVLHAVYKKQDYKGYFPDEEYEQVPDDFKAFVKFPDERSEFCHTPFAGKVIGEFVCCAIIKCSFQCSDWSALPPRKVPFTEMTDRQIAEYIGNGKEGYFWGISNLVIFENPLEIEAFDLIRPPQSWCYVEVADNAR